MSVISRRQCEQIFRKAGAREVTREAIDELQFQVDKIASEIARRALLFASDEARMRASRKDVQNAAREFMESALLDSELR